MENTDRKFIVGILFLVMAAFTIQCSVLYFNQESLEERYAKSEQTRTTFEEDSKKELISIYQLLGASAFTSRTNMNLSAKTNHYITHSKGRDGLPPHVTCDDCWEHFESFVKNMPPLPEGNEEYFERFYREPYKQLKKMREAN